MKKIYFVFTILIIVLFSYNFSFAGPHGPYYGSDYESEFPFERAKLAHSKTGAIYFTEYYNSHFKRYFYVATSKPLNFTFDSNLKKWVFYDFIDIVYFNNDTSTGIYNGTALLNTYCDEHEKPIILRHYKYDGENFNQVEDNSGSFYKKGDEFIRFEVPTNNGSVGAVQPIKISLSQLTLKPHFLSVKPNWRERVSESGYTIRYFIDGDFVDYANKLPVWSKAPSSNVIFFEFEQRFVNEKKYDLKVELLKDNDVISFHKVTVTCQFTFVDENGDGIDDNTGVELPGKSNRINSVNGFFEFIFGFFTSLFEALSRITKLLKEFVASSSEFAKVLVSIFSVNPVISSIFVLSLTVCVFLRILKR